MLAFTVTITCGKLFSLFSFNFRTFVFENKLLILFLTQVDW